MTASFDGAVLAGGASRRMGRDKALVPAPDGRPLVSVAVDALHAAGAGHVAVVGGDAVRLGALGVSLVPDHYPGEGPLGGILTALAAATEELVVVVACDMPGVGPAVPLALAASLAAATQSGVAVAVVGEREQPLTACWRRSIALGPLQAAFDRGVRAPRHVLAELNAVRVEGLPVSQLVDVDSPDDLRRYADRHPGPDREEEDTP